MNSLWWVVTLICSALFLVGTRVAVGRARTQDTAEPRAWELSLLLAAALAVRVVLSATAKGYAADIATFSAWASHAAEGLTSFYSPGYFADYPPGYVYVLWVVGKLRVLLGLGFDTPAFLILLKFPACVADLGAVWLLYRLARRYGAESGAVALAALYAFNPAVILDSAVWGQVDGVLTLFVLLGVLLLEEHPAAAGAAFAAALLVKPQALIFAPLPLLWFFGRLVRERSRSALADLLLFAGAAVALFAVAIWPFAAHEAPAWIFGKYGATLASYPYATLNAFNFFALVGGNLASTGDRLLFLPYSTWGTVFVLLICVFVALGWFRGRDASCLWYTPLFLAVSVFVLSAKMHERYLFPALAFGLGYYIVTRDRRALWLFGGFSLTQFFNTAEVLALSLRNVYAVPRFDPLLLAVSLANVLLWLLLAAIGYRRYVTGAPSHPNAA